MDDKGMIKAKYKHTNIVAKDWRKMAEFYEQVFGCDPVPPERRAVGEWVEQCTGVPGAEVRGIHLRLPGYGDDGPTLEIFEYNKTEEQLETAINRPGFAHLAFEVDDVEAARDEVIAAGGRSVGEMITAEITGAGTITLIYMTDPEGNIVELMKWE
jgi:predicted enzyme related to lactoylglutathione lyase